MKGALELVNEVVHHPVVEDEDVALGGTFLLVEPVGDSSRDWLVDDPEYIEARDITGIPNGLMLRVVEIGRDSHHNIIYFSTCLHEEVDEILIIHHLGILLRQLLFGSVFVIVGGSLCSSGRALLVRLVSAPHIFVVGPLSL